jgi:hypothetical protein
LNPPSSTNAWAWHRVLEKKFGKAKTHLCIWCLGPALDWAYLYGSEEELQDPDGRPFSLNEDDYAPMCRSCHRRYDSINDPDRVNAGPKAVGEWLRTKPPMLEEAQKKATEAARKHWEEHPEEWLAHQKAASEQYVASSLRRRCLDCDTVSRPGAMGKHISTSGHSGLEDVFA